MTAESIAAILKERFPAAVRDAKLAGRHPHVMVDPAQWPQVAEFLRDDPRLRFDLLRCITGVDQIEDKQLVAVFDLMSMQPGADAAQPWSSRHAFAVAVAVERDRPQMPSVAHVWPAADWHERETYDLLGIVFTGHPDSVEDHAGVHPRRILCPDDWDGHPLRKDYEFPLEYHDIPAVTEMGQARPVH
ncbi:MAG: NADH-quinone oxidoreductase subunit C [Phycisphaerae bacterium]